MLSHFAKRSLGQNFLKSEKALLEMVTAGDIRAGETIIEIGPGKGALTSKLLKKIYSLGEGVPKTRLVCIEKDDRLIPFLSETYQKDIENGVLEIIHGDIIDILNDKNQIEAIIKGSSKKISEVIYKVIANIPYYITGLIFRGIFDLDHLPEKIVLLVQKEVANRIMTYGDNGEQTGKHKGKESILSISIKLYGDPRRVSVVPRGAFVPAPTVDSAIIAVDSISRKIPKEQDIHFFEMIHSAFSHKRKRLAKNLESFNASSTKHSLNTKHSSKKDLNRLSKKPINQLTAIEYEHILVELGLDKNVRAEEISLKTYIQLFNRLL